MSYALDAVLVAEMNLNLSSRPLSQRRDKSSPCEDNDTLQNFFRSSLNPAHHSEDDQERELALVHSVSNLTLNTDTIIGSDATLLTIPDVPEDLNNHHDDYDSAEESGYDLDGIGKSATELIDINTKYQPEWGGAEAFREFYQNFKDGVLKSFDTAEPDLKSVRVLTRNRIFSSHHSSCTRLLEKLEES
ncbi:hypothetical protein P154DRAFT_350892 [Amniculicola lignicola CBS 123094]|uniref:Uncharacterized protein n=1 Tax=Amniculicola lignicola CBS 123094 TaxID=1392246 RepID=A0A6A5WTY2_9PLEO|nr:hypothetical protein P154DRAFT_350892 [Amniculicola lignicola CBS 123094]